MKILGTIKDTDIFTNRAPCLNKKLGELRRAVRVILLDENNKIALGYYPPKDNSRNGEYNLPGGGVNEGESIHDALLRESLEEVGCNIKNIKELGIIKEFNVGKNVKHNQDTYCFVANIDGNKNTPRFTEREKGDGLGLCWLSPEEAIRFINEQQPGFGKIRTLMCLR